MFLLTHLASILFAVSLCAAWTLHAAKIPTSPSQCSVSQSGAQWGNVRGNTAGFAQGQGRAPSQCSVRSKWTTVNNVTQVALSIDANRNIYFSDTAGLLIARDGIPFGRISTTAPPTTIAQDDTTYYYAVSVGANLSVFAGMRLIAQLALPAPPANVTVMVHPKTSSLYVSADATLFRFSTESYSLVANHTFPLSVVFVVADDANTERVVVYSGFVSWDGTIIGCYMSILDTPLSEATLIADLPVATSDTYGALLRYPAIIGDSVIANDLQYLSAISLNTTQFLKWIWRQPNQACLSPLTVTRDCTIVCETYKHQLNAFAGDGTSVSSLGQLSGVIDIISDSSTNIVVLSAQPSPQQPSLRLSVIDIASHKTQWTTTLPGTTGALALDATGTLSVLAVDTDLKGTLYTFGEGGTPCQ